MTQDRALDILKTGANVFLTGEPGAGKTHVINQYTAWLHAAGIPVAITAATGIAATHIGGMTIHSWSAVGTRDSLNQHDIESIIGKEYVAKRLRKTHVLIIDEISMLDANVLSMVDQILRAARNTPQEPFGGVQVVLVGDFFQLPPVTRQNEPVNYAFQSSSWEYAKPLVCYLTDQYRHEDELLSGLLRSIRINEIDESHYTLLEEQVDIAYQDIEPTRLFTHNAAVDELNSNKLKELPGAKKSYRMKTKGNRMLTDNLMRSCLSPAQLILCEDAMVMCTKNNFEAGYVNGTLGRVVGFDPKSQLPRIQTTDGRETQIEPATWSIMDHGKSIAEIEQIPLRLAWAITVHKSQGMSLDAVEMDLSRAFVYGQGYVALSRVRTLDGLRVLGMNPNALHVDPRIVQQDEAFRTYADAADHQFAAMPPNELRQLHEQFAKARGKTVPPADFVPQTNSPEPAKRISTYDETKQVLQEVSTIDAIARHRSLTISTVVGHIETLWREEKLTPDELFRSLPAEPNWEEVKDEIIHAMDQHGTERLKPLYEATNGAFDYHYLRLARLLYEGDVGTGRG
jgi:hypothetical protein